MSDAAIEKYVAWLAGQVRQMPVGEMREIVYGALCISEDHPALEGLREIYVRLNQCDQQLELIASGQLRLPLEEKPAA